MSECYEMISSSHKSLHILYLFKFWIVSLHVNYETTNFQNDMRTKAMSHDAQRHHCPSKEEISANKSHHHKLI